MSRSTRNEVPWPPGPRPWRALAGLLDGHWRRLVAGLSVSVLQAATALPVAWLIRRVFDTAGRGSSEPGLPVVAGLLSLTVLTGVLGAVGQLWVDQAIKRAMAAYRARLLSRIVGLPKAVHDAHERARFHDLVVHDTERTEILLGAVAGQMVPNGVVAMLLAVVLAIRSPGLFVVLLAALPVHYAIARLSLRRFQKAAAAVRRSHGAFSRVVAAGLRELELAWFNVGSERGAKAQRERVDALATSGIESAWRLSIHRRLQQFMYFAITATVLAVASRAVDRGAMSTGELLSFYVLAALMLNYVRDAGQGIGAVVGGRDAWLALHAFDAARFDPPYQGTRRLAFDGRIEIRDVVFRHETPGRERLVLDRVNLRLAPGRIVVLTGPNGSGKTTLLHLLLGMYRPASGELLADGVPYAELDLADLRRQIGVVPQDPLVVTGTLRENLAHAAPEATPGELEAAACRALADGFIREMPRGYETIVGEHGVLLSGGQRQRLALARALVTRPRLLVLDEPTNHVDQEGVRDLLLSLRALDPAPAILVVSHVPVVAALADEVVTLEGGRVVSVASS